MTKLSRDPTEAKLSRDPIETKLSRDAIEKGLPSFISLNKEAH